jgi:hypothetical protein
MYKIFILNTVGRNISVGIATRNGLYGLPIESLWRRDFPHPSRTPLGSTQPPVQRVSNFFPPGVKRPGRGVDHPPQSSARVKEGVELHLSSPSEPSRPVLGRPLPLYASKHRVVAIHYKFLLLILFMMLE